MKPNTGSRFQSFELDEKEDEIARAVTPYFLAYLQNKIASYADAVVNFRYDPGTDLSTAVIEHEKLKAQVEILEELMRELTVPAEQSGQVDQS